MSVRALAITAAAAMAAAAALVPGLVLSGHSSSSGAVQFTGTQLSSALLPGGAFPAGYAIDQAGAVNSGAQLENAPARYHLATGGCPDLQVALLGGSGGFGESAYALDAAANAPVRPRQFIQVIYQFKTAGAAASFFTGMRAYISRCPSFVLPDAPPLPPLMDPITSTMRAYPAAPVGRYQAFSFTVSDVVDGMNMSQRTELVTDSGTDVICVAASGWMATPPASPATRTLALKLLTQIQALR